MCERVTRNVWRSEVRFALLAMLLLCRAAAPQAPAEWRDDLVERLAGTWSVTGKIAGRSAHHDVRAEWVLNHQFLQIEERTSASAPRDERRYDAVWFLGHDLVESRYVLHLMDIFGGRYSETIGRGTREGNEIHFVFEYPDGPFRSAYRWDSQNGTWQWLMEQKEKTGAWAPFADLQLRRMGNGPQH